MLVDMPQLWTFDVNGAFQYLPTWGVWCTDHSCWVAQGPWTEREAWQALLAVDSTHPMRLEIRAYNGLGPTQDEDWVECEACSGDGTCFNCDQECPKCNGSGEVNVEELARYQRRSAVARLGRRRAG